MATTHWVFNISTEQFARSVTQPTPVAHPRLFYGDVKSIGVIFIENAGDNKVSVVQTFTAVQVGIGNVGSSPASTATASAPNASWEYPLTLPLNLAAVSSLIVGNTKTLVDFEFRVVDVTGPNRYQAKVYIAPQLISDTVADPIAPEVALSRNEGAALYVPKEWPAGMRMAATTDSGRRFLVYPHDDGTFHFDEIP